MSRTPRLLAKDIFFGEGPRWRDGRLWFSDFNAYAVKSVSMAGDVRTEFEIDDMPSGLGWMPDGSLLVVSMRRRQVLHRYADGRVALHADLNGVASFHCNDMVVDAAGRAYVGNFGFDLDAEMAKRGAAGVFADHATADLALVSAAGVVSIAASGLHFPNGSVITPDGATLIVAETFGQRLTAFDIAQDGTLSHRRVWAQAAPRAPDGIALDADGAIWISNPLAPECARIAEGGEVLEVIETGGDPSYAVMLGGEAGTTLFVLTAPPLGGAADASTPRGKILAVEVDAPRAGWP
jgi:sugar lactone lactonase YvrE